MLLLPRYAHCRTTGLMLIRLHVPEQQVGSAPSVVHAAPDGLRQLAPQFVRPPGQVHAPFWQVAPPAGALHAVPFALGLHLPCLQTFLPFFFSQSPLWHFSHSLHFGWHLPDLRFASVVVTGSRPSAPPSSAPSVRRRFVVLTRALATASN